METVPLHRQQIKASDIISICYDPNELFKESMN